MQGSEFIIALTEHRVLGNILLPYLITPCGPYYSIERVVKLRDLGSYDYEFGQTEKQLVRLIDSYAEEKLAKKFSRGKGFTQFFSEMEPSFYQGHVIPYVEKIIYSCLKILMHENIRFFRKAFQYSNLYDEDVICLPRGFAEPVFYFDRRPDETRYLLKLFQDREEIRVSGRDYLSLTQEPGAIVLQNRLYVFKDLPVKKIQPFRDKPYVSVLKPAEEKYFSSFVLHTIRDYKTVASGFKIIEEYPDPEACLLLEYNLLLEPAFSFQFIYGKEYFLPNSSRMTAVIFDKAGDDYVFTRIKRNPDREAEIANILTDLGLREKQGFYQPLNKSYLDKVSALYEIINWINSNQEKLKVGRIRIGQGKLDKKYFTGEQDLKLEVAAKNDWFDVYIVVRFGEFRVPFIKLKDLILNGIREFELPNGETAVLPSEWFARFSGLFAHSRIEADKLRLRQHHFMLLKQQLSESTEAVTRNFPENGFTAGSPVTLPANLKAELRAYQKTGFDWFNQLHQHNFGGCLADDMGLGKTLQTLAFLLKLKKLRKLPDFAVAAAKSGQLSLFGELVEEEKYQPASLIVLPTSLVHNWINEIRKFTPDLKVYQHSGSARNKEAGLSTLTRTYDVILTTYGTVRNDIEILVQSEFFYLILDESQYIKNPDSKTYQAIMKIRSQNRLVLTGTPIENSLSDLWAQMNFLNRGLLGNLPFFRQYYLGPIEKNGDEKRQEQLKSLIRPFILRRTKAEVARDLPPLMEQIRYCTMSPDQQIIYEREKSVIRNSILETIDREGLSGKSSILLLQGLTRLRQLANHPSMIIDDEDAESGKFSEIFHELGNLMAENHKVLIFSSFVKHLDLLKAGIEAKGWKFSMLIGKTTDREKVISQFNNDPENRIFLISLKAGGVGLNLTGADYVFIVDPWWNPASENQAISRAHRIGQEKHVFVYRFITLESIEEKIQQLKERKAVLADKFVNTNNPFKSVSKEDITDLLY